MTINLPKLPEANKNLYENFNPAEATQKYSLETTCDCQKENQDIKLCPHLQHGGLQFLNSLPLRLALLEHNKAECQDNARQQLFDKIITQVYEHVCPKQKDEANDEGSEEDKLLHYTTARPHAIGNCHVYRDLQKLFPYELNVFQNPVAAKKPSKMVNIMINFSFCGNVLLVIMKVIALFMSNSLAMLAATLDSVLDVCTGLVLYLCIMLAKKGIEKAHYQMTIHGNMAPKRYVYGSRFESIGVLAFACMTGTVAIILFEHSVEHIVDIFVGEPDPVDFDFWPTFVLCFTVGLKLTLAITCWIAIKTAQGAVEALRAYRDDHRNDTLTNSVGLLGALLAVNLQDTSVYWQLCDPLASGFLAVYIFYNWAQRIYENMKLLSGEVVEKAVLDDFLLRVLCQFDASSKLQEVVGITGYQSGMAHHFDLVVRVDSGMTAVQVHDVCQELQTEAEKVDSVERCYVHVEVDGSRNEL